jgi:hypothetical protein
MDLLHDPPQTMLQGDDLLIAHANRLKAKPNQVNYVSTAGEI